MASSSSGSATAAPTGATLYKWPSAWGLPSASPACVQVEAYLRLCGQSVDVQECSTTNKSPSGQLPALEHGQDISAGLSEFGASQAAITLARKSVKDLDAQLSPGQRAEALAFATLIEHRLNVATSLCMWCEPAGYRESKQALFAGQPFPLNYVLPLTMRRDIKQQYAHLSTDKVYQEACEVISAVADHLRSTSSSGRYFFGAKPTSLDAVLYGHLAFYRSSPAAAPVLQQKVSSQLVVCEYLDHIAATAFKGVPIASAASAGKDHAASGSSASGSSASAAGGSWSESAKGAKPSGSNRPPTAAELDFRRKSWWWLATSGALVLGYVLLSGKYISLDTLSELVSRGDDDEDDDDADMDDDDGHDD